MISPTNTPPSDESIGFQVRELHSPVVDNPFLVFFLSVPTRPSSVIVPQTDDGEHRLELLAQDSEMVLVCQMYCPRFDANVNTAAPVTQYLGSATVDLSQCEPKTYTLVLRDSSSRPALRVGQVTLQMTRLCTHLLPAENRLQVHSAQNSNIMQQLAQASEANLTHVHGFGVHGLLGIVPGLERVHSPYYTNHLGATMPSGAFCMIPTCVGCDMEQALLSHRQRLQVAIARNVMSEETFVQDVADLLHHGIKSKHIRCLVVIADALTLHARMDIVYNPDVQLTPTAIGTERWEIPREPRSDGTVCFTGDCEDFAREVYQQCKEIVAWVSPSVESGDVMESMSAVLHLYVPTIEQGAVDSHAHSKYITYEAAYRNHIWAALHPREAWRTKLMGSSVSLDTLYKKWPRTLCEATLPVLHLEGTGDVYPVVTTRKPGYVLRLAKLAQEKMQECPMLKLSSTPDMSLQCNGSSTFYKYAIACMTDVFQEQGYLDFTYITNNKYGCPIGDWARGKYKFTPSTRHSPEIMQRISHMIKLERPIPPITVSSSVVRAPILSPHPHLRFGQNTPFEPQPDTTLQGEYIIGDNRWYELYFPVDRNTVTDD